MKTRFAVAFLLLLFSFQYASAWPGQFTQKDNLSFVANAGQITDQHYNLRKDIDYKLNAAGMDIFVGDGQIHYQWSKSESPTAAAKTKLRETKLEESKVNIYRMDVELVGANKNAKVIAEEPQAFYERYYTMETGEEGRVAHSYQKITYQDIYPNIDWVLYTRDKQLKYDFVVRPGGNVADIQLKYAGATSLQLEDGALTATTPFGSITEQKPYSYEAITGKEINSRYVLQNGVLSFKAGNYDGTLVIDPVLDWATYYGGPLGGSGEDYIGGVVTDPAFNIYAYGSTVNTSNIATAGAFQTNFTVNIAGFLVKLNTLGQRQWATYYNGGVYSITTGPIIACDAIGMVYITGTTTNTANMTTPGCHQPVYGGGTSDGFIAKFNSAGQRLWGTYYGGSDYDIGSGIAIDLAGNVLVDGTTLSTSIIATPGSHLPNLAGSVDNGFIAKFNNAGQRLWGTYYTGLCNSITTDANNNIVVGGITFAISGIATPGCHQPVPGGNTDGHLAKFNSAGQRLWGTYYGGLNDDLAYKVATDISGNIYLSGITQSNNNIASTGAHQTTFSGPANFEDGFLAKFDANGQRQWGTYYGGTGIDGILAMSFDAIRNIYLSGYTTTTTGLTTPGSYQPLINGNEDAILVKFNQNGQRLWGSYFGASNDDESLSITNDAAGNIIMVGATTSTSGLSTAGSHQPVYGGGFSDGFIAKFTNEDTLVYIQAYATDTVLCAGDSVHVGYGVSHSFRINNTFTLQLSDAAGSFAAPVNLKVLSTNAGGIITGLIPGTVVPGTDYRIRIIASAPADTSLYKVVRIRPKPAAPSAGSNTPVCTGQAINLNALTGAAGASYHWTGPASYSSNVQSPTRANATTAMGGVYNVTVTVDGCTSAATPTTVVVNPSPAAPVAGSNSPICAGTSLNLTASLVPGTSYSWNGPGAFTSNQQNPVINPAGVNAAGTYTVNVTDGNGCVSANVTTTVVINNSNAPTVGVFPNPNDSVCPGVMVTFIAVPNNGGTPTYQWYKNSLQIPGATNATYMTNTVSTGDFYSVAMTSTAVCAVPATVNSNNVIMTVVPPVVPSVTISASPGLNVGPWRMITFTATPVNGGSSPTYQWLRNGQPVIGAVSNTWGANNLSDNDVISVVLFSSEVCAIPPTDTSNTQLVHINLGIDDDSHFTSGLQLYPNPSRGNFTIISKQSGVLYLSDMSGMVLQPYNILEGKTSLQLPATLTPGVYVTRFVYEGNSAGKVDKLVYRP